MALPTITLPAGEAHLWIHDLTSTPATIAEKKSLLSQEEIARANRFLHPRDHDRYIISHARTREILAQYLAVPPEAVSYEFEKFGKPRLPARINPANLQFNLSHSGSWMALAVVLNARIGVDIEVLQPESASLDVAARFFTPRENQELRSLSGQAQVQAFFNCWTRKEAYLKAIGFGLTASPENCEVSLLPGDPPAIRRTLPSENPNVPWCLFHFNSANCVIAVAINALVTSLKTKAAE
jgi:4'-phosphopantetheinyl transferase